MMNRKKGSRLATLALVGAVLAGCSQSEPNPNRYDNWDGEFYNDTKLVDFDGDGDVDYICDSDRYRHANWVASDMVDTLRDKGIILVDILGNPTPEMSKEMQIRSNLISREQRGLARAMDAERHRLKGE